MRQKVAILGSGGMGTACATVLEDNNHNVIIYGVDHQELEELKNGKNSKYFSDKINLPKFQTTANIDEAIQDADYILFAIPTQFIEDVFKSVISKITKPTIFINVSKGFWPDTAVSVYDEMSKLIKTNSNITGVVSLIGPSFAIDIVERHITLVDAVAYNKNIAKKVQKLFSNEWFRVYTQNDVKGAEVGAIFKNIISIASGMAEGLGYSTNTQVALVSRSINEILTYNKYVGGKKSTIFGLSGIGDLILTALSPKSRNYTFGKNFFSNTKETNNKTVEGLRSIKVIYENYIKNGRLELPIVEALYKIIYMKNNIKEVIKSLMVRPLKHE
ncbi:glycerol-3-phosphate dehydrogenase [[Mycoplasma] phocae]|uniref:Glycerol-3-phosphate dehydrogenase [NAD(P)+] n=1 Tax=[Mycoplasma] phocae TaxID=142651 RepID=A0A2Z5IR65_9BACT|nr:NAD(P)H-dependent glycerol-3-phosphate dehydrogenase [[Mycoplasma] phocae]AXE60726.1 glycerol-3-phosphate dehydrogenase [[Mycoplasma] phocae]